MCMLYSSSLYLKTLSVISFGHATIKRWFGFHVTLFEGLCPSSRVYGIHIVGCTSDPFASPAPASPKVVIQLIRGQTSPFILSLGFY